jgi:hypothetical protein
LVSADPAFLSVAEKSPIIFFSYAVIFALYTQRIAGMKWPLQERGLFPVADPLPLPCSRLSPQASARTPRGREVSITFTLPNPQRP